MKFHRLYVLLASVLFLLFFLSFLNVKLWDVDFWWHIATGREIVVHNQMPTLDNFNFVTQHNRALYPQLSAREPVLLKQYWLSQVALYLSYEGLGSWGVVVLRSLLLSVVLWLMLRGLRTEGVPGLLSLLLLIPSFFVLLHKFPGERPVLFTFALSMAVFNIMNGVSKERLKHMFLLPPLMLLWANLHGAFVLGLVIILAFWAEETLRLLLNRSQFSGREYGFMTAIIAVSILITIINPSGWGVFAQMAETKYKIFEESVQEYQPLLGYYKALGVPYDRFVLVALGIACTALLRLPWMRLSHIILLGGFLAMGLLHQRFFVFCATIGIVIAGRELVSLWKFLSCRFALLSRPSLQIAASVIAVGCITLFVGRTSHALSGQIPSWTPDHENQGGRYAVDFIKRNKIPGRMFNSHAVGGYLIWKLYPWKQVFSDTRSTDIASYVEYSYVFTAVPGESGKRPGWERLLEMYGVNFMVVSPQDYVGALSPLVKALLENDRWALVQHDPEYMVFVKNTELNRDVIKRHQKTPNDTYWMLIYKTSHMLLNSPNPHLYATVGYCFEKLGNPEEAGKAYRSALKSMPENKSFQEAVARVSASAGTAEAATN